MVDVPKDIQNESTEFIYPTDPINLPGYHPPKETNESHLQEFVNMVNAAEKPVILAGHGVLLSRACKEVMDIAEKVTGRKFEELVNTICMISPFSLIEKQKLIEAIKIENKLKALDEIINFNLLDSLENNTVQ